MSFAALEPVDPVVAVSDARALLRHSTAGLHASLHRQGDFRNIVLGRIPRDGEEPRSWRIQLGTRCVGKSTAACVWWELRARKLDAGQLGAFKARFNRAPSIQHQR